MAKFLEDIYGKRFWTETPEDWDAVFLAAKEAGAPMTGEVATYRKYRELEYMHSKIWTGNLYLVNGPYSITTQDVLAVLRLEKLCKKKPGLKEAIKKAEGLGIRPGVEVEWTGVRPYKSGKFTVPPYERWSDCISGWAWADTLSPNRYCWIVGKSKDYYNAKPTGKYAIVNQPFGLVSSAEDNEIRVGDTVERGPGWEWGDQDKGTTGVVVKEKGNGWFDVRWEHGGTPSYRWSKDGHKDIQKINAGGRSSTTNNQTHGQVQGTSEQDSGRAEGRTAQRPDAGRQGATGSGHPGQRASQPPSRFRGAKGTLRFTL